MKRLMLSFISLLAATYILPACSKSDMPPDKHVLSIPLDQAIVGVWHTPCDTEKHGEEQWEFLAGGEHDENLLGFDEKDKQCLTSTSTSAKDVDTHYKFTVQNTGSKARGIVTITSFSKKDGQKVVDYGAAVVKGDYGPELYLRVKGSSEPVITLDR